ncbi:MAG: excinuclease ABC subunit UvrA [Planctomycetota bacterium]
MEPTTIEVKNARVHNLQSVSVSLPRKSLIVFTGVSGSGKSSLAFDTLYAEGQRRYIESLSSYARQFMGQMQKPDCDQITGLSPAIAIQQKTTGWNPRSTVGTITAIYDFLRVLYARIGTQHCTECDRPIAAQSREQIVAGIGSAFGEQNAKVLVLAPVARGQKGEFRDLFDDLIRAGYVRARVDGDIVELRENLALEKNRRHDIEVVIDRLVLNEAGRGRLAEAVEAALRVGSGSMLVAPMESVGEKTSRIAERVFSSKYACSSCGISYEPPTPQLFSFNSPSGMCLTCDGLGELTDFDPALLVPDPTLKFYDPCVAPMRTKIGKWRRHVFEGVAKVVGFDINKPWKELPQKARDALLFGTGDRHITYEWKWSGGVWKHGGTFEGVIAELRDKYRKAKAGFVREYYEKYMRRGSCPDCKGARLNKQASAVRLVVGGKPGPRIQELCAMSVSRATETIGRLTLTPVQQIVAEEVLKEVRTRLEFLRNVGLDYITLERTAPTLSGGELQRIRLAGQIGSGLTGVLYILDEPSIGLHARDNEKLLASLLALRDMGNTVIVVEHDEATMRAADYIVDFGPGPGVRGGHVVAHGDFDDVIKVKESLTAQYLTGARNIEVPVKRRPVTPIDPTMRRRNSR